MSFLIARHGMNTTETFGSNAQDVSLHMWTTWCTPVKRLGLLNRPSGATTHSLWYIQYPAMGSVAHCPTFHPRRPFYIHHRHNLNHIPTPSRHLGCRPASFSLLGTRLCTCNTYWFPCCAPLLLEVSFRAGSALALCNRRNLDNRDGESPVRLASVTNV